MTHAITSCNTILFFLPSPMHTSSLQCDGVEAGKSVGLRRIQRGHAGCLPNARCLAACTPAVWKQFKHASLTDAAGAAVAEATLQQGGGRAKTQWRVRRVRLGGM